MIRLKESNYLGWNVYALENEWSKISIAPQLGGRIIQLEMSGHEFLFANQELSGKRTDSSEVVNDGTWLNFGGEKIWPAPQGWDHDNQWPGPPDVVLDGGVFEIEEKINDQHGSEAFLSSPVDEFTGLQIQRTISLVPEKTEVRVRAKFYNFSDRQKKWSIWPVCQVKGDDLDKGEAYHVICPIGKKSQHPKGFKVMHGVVNNPQFRREKDQLLINYKYLVGKVGLDSDAGWVAYIHKKTGKVLIYKFQVEMNAAYPDNTSVQIWSQGKGLIYSRNRIIEFENDQGSNFPYMELEILSPLVELPPNGSMEFDYKILTSTISQSGEISHVNEIGVIESSICIVGQNNELLVKAKYGVFGKGVLKIQLRTLSEIDTLNEETIFQTDVSPIEGVSINLSLNSKNWKKESKILVLLFDTKNRFLGELDEFIYE